MNNLVKPNKPCTNQKPALTKWVDGMWGRERVRTFDTDSQLHYAFEEWNKAKSKNETLEVTTCFEDGSGPEVDVLEHCTKTVEYKDYDGEVWELEQETSKWDACFMGEYLSQKGVKEAYHKWYDETGQLKDIVSVTLKVVPNE